MVCLGFEPGRRMVGADETTELWRLPLSDIFTMKMRTSELKGVP